MDLQIWPFFWGLAALFLAVAFHFLLKKSSRISDGASPSSSQSEFQAENQPYAASNSSNSALPVEYEVFLSFRGPDVRKTFADVLYKFLYHSKVRTFLDDKELGEGEIIAPSLEKAIKESKVYIPILSSGYASSKWCLQELALMVKWCKQGDDRIILPIFYMMEPRDVRHQERSYKKAFQSHRKKYDAEIIEEWKEALKEVGEMKGWSIKQSDSQGDIIEKVYSKVWSHLLRSYKLVTDELVGIDSHVQQVTRLLSSDSEGMKVVGIHGMGGMGKTTIAKDVYNKVYSQFDRFCFVEDAREILSKSEGIVALQNKIISSILRTDYKVTDASEGLHVIKDRVCKHKVLVVLDDVNNLFEFDQILGKLDNFSRESRFIVTTRDKRVLEVLQECKFYEPREMSNDHALQLFSKHAFGTDNPPEEDASVSMEFVKVAAGLPLALKVIGSLLFRRDREFWAAKLMELKDIPPAKLQERLKVSYNELSDNEKQIFLDIACFFIGKEKDFPFYMWSDCKFYPQSGINTLLLRSLVKFNERNEFWMHDHIRDLGRAIVREEDSQRPWKRSRIWSKEDALDILKTGEGSDRVEFLRVDMKDENLKLTDKEFKKLSGLRYLEVYGGNLIGDFKGVLPNLRWLRLKYCRSIPSDLNMKKLVIFEMDGCPVKDEWRGWSGIKVASNLKAIHLHFCREIRTAPDLSQCRNLEWIDFHDCLRMRGEIHIGKLSNLKTLEISGCTGLTEVMGFGRLESLTELNMSGCSSVEKFMGIENLGLLEDLQMSLTEVMGFGRLELLTELNMSGCSSVKELPDLSCLRNIVSLDISKCNQLKEVRGIESLELLEQLVMSNCSWIKKLPDLSGCKKLCRLNIGGCVQLAEVSGIERLGSLKWLNMSGCSSVEELPDLSGLGNIESLYISECNQLKEVTRIGSLERLETLRSLNMTDCTSITKFPDLSALANLRELDISGCTGLTGVMVIPRLELLTELNMSGCSSVEELPDFSDLTKLQELSIHKCTQLAEVTSLERLEDLRSLSMTDCTSITKFPDLSALTNLRKLDISGCIGLTEVLVIPRLESLTELNMSGCRSVEELPDLSGLGRMIRLDIRECNQLKEVTGIESWEQLEYLFMTNCTSIKKLPDLSGCKKLGKLDISGCAQLAEVGGIERLESLKWLIMSDCSSVQELPDLSGLGNIESLDISGCNQLKEVTGIGSLELLEELSMRNCTSMKKLSDLSGCKGLRWLDIRRCVQLAEVSGIDKLEGLTVER
ncbi:Disease resistance protein L6 [Linum perenne]